MVEFALVLPIVLVLALSVMQVGLLARDRLAVAEAARAGAREAAVGPDDDAVRAAALSAGGLDPAATEVAIERSGGRGLPVSVTVRYAAPVRVPLLDRLFPPSVTLSARVVNRQEYG